MSVCRITKKLSIIEVFSRALPHKSLHLQHIITKPNYSVLHNCWEKGSQNSPWCHLTYKLFFHVWTPGHLQLNVCLQQSSVIWGEDKTQKLNTLQYSSQIIRRQTYKSPMLEDSSGPATAHVRQKPTESFERSGGARAPVLRSDLVLLILL